jgi:hypothetical protein
VRVDGPTDIDRPLWVPNELLPEGREIRIVIRDLLLVLSGAASTWLLAMLEVMVSAAEVDGLRDLAAMHVDKLPGDHPGGPTRVTAHAFHPGEVSRPRWDGRELVVTLSSGDVVLIFSAAAAAWLVEVLRVALGGR